MRKMICRLCLNEVKHTKRIPLYKVKINPVPTEYIQMIEKYIQLKVPWDDSISTSICKKCGDTLKDFDQFREMIKDKQTTLKSQVVIVDNLDLWPKENDKKNGESNGLEGKLSEEAGDFEDSEENLAEKEICDAGSQSDEEKEFILEDEDLPTMGFLEETEIQLEDYIVSDVEEENNRIEANSEDDLPLIDLKKPKPNKSGTKNSRRSEAMEKKPTDPKDSKEKTKRTSLMQSEVIKQNEEIIAKHMNLFCDLCSRPSESFSKLRLHFLEVHNEKTAYVKCCNNKYTKPSKLVDHLKWHQNPEAFKCKVCDKQLKGQNCLEVHMTTKHRNIKPFTEATEGILLCPYCPRKFRTEGFLKKHVQRHENGLEEEFVCNLCGKRFINIHRLRRHIEAIHENLHPYVCDICGKKFKFKPSFDKHILEHRGIVEKPIQCEDCGQWLKNEHTYRWHRLSHDKTEIPCTYCGKICPSKIALRGHISYMHSQKPLLQCKYCEKSFKEKKNYTEHLAVHTRALLYSCQYCSKEFRSKSNMYVHVKRKHVLEWKKAKLAKSHDPYYKQAND